MADPNVADPNVTVKNNPDESRYEVFVDGDLAGFSAYRAGPGRIVITHTKIDPDYEGHGVGSVLARGVLDDSRAQGLEVVPRCPFIAEYIRRHPDYQDLVKT